MATSTTTAPQTAFRTRTLTEILAEARASKSLAFPQFNDAYFAKWDRLAVIKKAARLGYYAAGEQVAASAPTWNQDANYGKGAVCVSCLTANGHAFSAPIDHFIAVFPVDGVPASETPEELNARLWLRRTVQGIGREGELACNFDGAVVAPVVATLLQWGLAKKVGRFLKLTPAGLEYAQEKGLLAPLY